MFGFHRADLRHAALRGLLVFGTLAALLIYSNRRLPPSFMLVVVSNALGFAVLATATALIEQRAGRSSWTAGGGLWVLLAATACHPVLIMQGTVSGQIALQGSVSAGISKAMSLLSSGFFFDTQLLQVSFASALPWAIVAAARLQRRAYPCLVTLGLGTVMALALADLMGPQVAETLLTMTVALHALAWAADLIERRIVRRLLRGEVRALQALVTAGQLRSKDLWLLAAADEPAARLILGEAAPEEHTELEPWIGQLLNGGRLPLQRAAVAAARMTMAWSPEHRAAFAALDAWDQDPSPESVTVVDAALDGLPEHPQHPAIIALRAAHAAVSAQGTWAAETIRAATVRAAAQAAELNDAAAVRTTIGAAIRDRLLGEPAPTVPTT